MVTPFSCEGDIEVQVLLGWLWNMDIFSADPRLPQSLHVLLIGTGGTCSLKRPVILIDLIRLRKYGVLSFVSRSPILRVLGGASEQGSVNLGERTPALVPIGLFNLPLALIEALMGMKRLMMLN